MRMTVYLGWQIEPRSFRGESDRWWPRALVSVLDGGRLCTHDVRALLTVTFDAAPDADDYAVRMAKRWIEDHARCPVLVRGDTPGDDGGAHELGAHSLGGPPNHWAFERRPAAAPSASESTP